MCEKWRTALWHAVISRFVATVAKLLSRRAGLGLKEPADPAKVNKLFLCVIKCERFADCFSRCELSIHGVLAVSVQI